MVAILSSSERCGGRICDLASEDYDCTRIGSLLVEIKVYHLELAMDDITTINELRRSLQEIILRAIVEGRNLREIVTGLNISTESMHS